MQIVVVASPRPRRRTDSRPYGSSVISDMETTALLTNAERADGVDDEDDDAEQEVEEDDTEDSSDEEHHRATSSGAPGVSTAISWNENETASCDVYFKKSESTPSVRRPRTLLYGGPETVIVRTEKNATSRDAHKNAHCKEGASSSAGVHKANFVRDSHSPGTKNVNKLTSGATALAQLCYNVNEKRRRKKKRTPSNESTNRVRDEDVPMQTFLCATISTASGKRSAKRPHHAAKGLSRNNSYGRSNYRTFSNTPLNQTASLLGQPSPAYSGGYLSASTTLHCLHLPSSASSPCGFRGANEIRERRRQSISAAASSDRTASIECKRFSRKDTRDDEEEAREEEEKRKLLPATNPEGSWSRVTYLTEPYSSIIKNEPRVLEDHTRSVDNIESRGAHSDMDPHHRRRTESAVVLTGECQHGFGEETPLARGRGAAPVHRSSFRCVGGVSPCAIPRRHSGFVHGRKRPAQLQQQHSQPQKKISATSAGSLMMITPTHANASRSPTQQWGRHSSGNCVIMPGGGALNVGTGLNGQPQLHADVLGNDHARLGLGGAHNPLYDVSNEFMRVTGYGQQFKRLLSKRKDSPRRQGSAVSAGAAASSGDPNRDRDVEKGGLFGYSLPSGPGVGSSHELNEQTTLTAAAVALGVRLPTASLHSSSAPGADEDGQEDNAKRNAVKFGKQRSAYGRLWKEQPNLKHRLKKRKNLFFQRIKISDFSLLFALAGITLTVLEAELRAANVIKKDGYESLLLRSLVVVTTLILLALIICYHAIETKIAVIDSGAQDWRVAITHDRLWQCAIEVAICAVCPFPGNFDIYWDRFKPNHRQTVPVAVPLDAILSIPMFLRAYLMCRFMALHSRQFQDAATRSIAALNHIAVNFTFVLKTLMHEHPLRVLVMFTVAFWVAMSWILTQCERFIPASENPEDNHYLNSIWFIIITFMSIGYGDIVPNTYCGRALAITTGIVGAGVSSALIAVISRKLELSRAEKHVNQFMTDSKLTRQRKEAAASVLQHTWFIHKYKNIPKAKDDMKLRLHQRKFLAAINEFRKVKWDQRKLAEQGNALVDVAKLQNDMHETLWDMQQNQDHLVAQLGLLMQKVQELQDVIVSQNVQYQQNAFSQPARKTAPAVGITTTSPQDQDQTPGQVHGARAKPTAAVADSVGSPECEMPQMSSENAADAYERIVSL